MAGITLAQAQAKLEAWLDAEEKIAAGQSYSIAGRSLTRADLKVVGERITYWNNKVQQLTRGTGIRVTGGTPVG